MGQKVQRAELPRAPEHDAASRRAADEGERYLREREGAERRSVLRGLMLLALVALAFSVWRAGLARAFMPGWWRPW
jgi:hypothetical protein